MRHREGREDFKLNRGSKQPACLGSQLAGLPQAPQLSIPDEGFYQPSQKGERGFIAGMWAAALLNSGFTEPKPRFNLNTGLIEGARQHPGQRCRRTRLSRQAERSSSVTLGQMQDRNSQMFFPQPSPFPRSTSTERCTTAARVVTFTMLILFSSIS